MAVSKRDEQLMTLARYYMSAELMRLHALDHMKAKVVKMKTDEGKPKRLQSKWHTDACRSYIELWLATLYVVVEGYNKLELECPEIDALMDEKLIERLKLFRHGVFHYVPKWWSMPHTRLIDIQPGAFPNSLAWAQKLHFAIFHFLKPHVKLIETGGLLHDGRQRS